jgi:type 2 lantibiotic biosynthesis protein LanM
MPTLRQRLAELRSNSENRSIELDKVEVEQIQLQFLETWKQEVAGSDQRRWDKRLELDGLNEAACINAISHTLMERNKPQGKHLGMLLQVITPCKIQDSPQHLSKDSTPFEDLWEAAASNLTDSLIEAHSQKCHCSVSSSVAWDLKSHLVRRLTEIADQGTWEMFHNYRKPGEFMVASLQSDSGLGPSTQAYDRFVLELLENKLEPLLCSYPVLARHINTVVRQWWANCMSLLARIHNDRRSLSALFNIPMTSRLEGVLFNAGDYHNDGGAVAILSFQSDGSSLHKLVYKPKDLELERRFNDLLESHSATQQDPPLRYLKVLTKGDYGYVEYLEHRTCTNQEELERFYYCSGRLMGLLFLLGCTDCHYENFVAHSDSLVLVDPETLFEPSSLSVDQSPNSLSTRFSDSVLRTGMLPYWTLVGPARHPVDISCLGVDSPDCDFKEMYGWKFLNTDAMMPSVNSVPHEPRTSLPYHQGCPNIADEHIEPITRGFRNQLEAVEKEKEQWLSKDGFLQPFFQCTRRVVLRNTRVYAALQQQQLSPHSLRSEAHQGIILEKLARSYLQFDPIGDDWHLFNEEVRQMESLDIPFFTASMKPEPSREKLGLLSRNSTAVSSAIDRINRISESEIQFQISIITNILNLCRASRINIHAAQDLQQYVTVAGPSTALGKARKLELSKAIGDSIHDTAIMANTGTPDWLGVDTIASGSRLQFGMLGDSLYGGRTGVALFLASLGEEYLLTARRIYEPIFQVLESRDNYAVRRYVCSQPLGISGIGGVLLSLLLMADIDKPLAERYRFAALEIINCLTSDDMEQDTAFDVIGGSAGLIGPLTLCGSDWAIALAIKAVDRLATCQNDNGAWINHRVSNVGLTGFAHGCSGIALAVMKAAVYVQTGDYDFVISKALQYERMNFNQAMRNWPDLRTSGGYGSSWCHGGPGVLLSRLELWKSKRFDDLLWGEIEAGIDICSNQGQDIDTLCCGRYGRIVILGLASRYLTGKDSLRCQAMSSCLEEDVLRLSTPDNLSKFKLYPKACLQIQNPGLFNGVSGIGLSLANRSVVEVVLTAGLGGL